MWTLYMHKDKKSGIPSTAAVNTFLIQSAIAFVVKVFNGSMMTGAKPSLFKRSSVDLFRSKR